MDSKLINQKSQDLIANLYSWSSPDLHFGQPHVFTVLTRWSPLHYIFLMQFKVSPNY